MYMAKQCIWLNNECYYAMYMAKQCILLCNVFGYAMYVDMQCMWICNVCVCELTKLAQYFEA